MKAKARLKQLLNFKTLYTDGMRPEEIAQRVRTERNPHGFYMNDLKRQDRQTDNQIILVELAIYKLLGVDESLLDLWKEVHNSWFWKSEFYSGFRESMRLTG